MSCIINIEFNVARSCSAAAAACICRLYSSKPVGLFSSQLNGTVCSSCVPMRKAETDKDWVFFFTSTVKFCVSHCHFQTHESNLFALPGDHFSVFFASHTCNPVCSLYVGRYLRFFWEGALANQCTSLCSSCKMLR